MRVCVGSGGPRLAAGTAARLLACGLRLAARGSRLEARGHAGSLPPAQKVGSTLLRVQPTLPPSQRMPTLLQCVQLWWSLWPPGCRQDRNVASGARNRQEVEESTIADDVRCRGSNETQIKERSGQGRSRIARGPRHSPEHADPGIHGTHDGRLADRTSRIRKGRTPGQFPRTDSADRDNLPTTER